MIDAEKRSLLTDALTPPPGCRFDSGVVTTYSLDLVTLLTLPLHLSWLASGEERPEQVDPIRMVEALRRTADRLTVFCERGRILAPRIPTPLLGLLERIVHEATAPHGGTFHPKVWLLRFVSPDSEEQAHLRLLVMSRNLTNDASWDLSLQLDGRPTKKRLAANRPLAEFLRSVALQSGKAITADRETLLSALIEEARRCEWELPPGFDEIRFHALGLGPRPSAWLPMPAEYQWDELGVISPFLGPAALESLRQSTNSASFLVSRPEELDTLPEPLIGGFSSVMVLDERADFGDEEDDNPGTLRGLHAKVYVARRAWNSHLFLGSANATDNALVHGRNVEFMAELIGKHAKVGRPETWLGEKGLQHLLLPYQRSPQVLLETDLAAREQLTALHRTLSTLPLEIDCVAVGGNWSLRLSGLQGLDVGEASLAIWPLTLNAERAVSLAKDQGAAPFVIGLVGKQEITSLTGFLLKLDDEELRFGLDVPLRNAPTGRDLEILRLALRNRDGFVRYLALLLGDWIPANGSDEDPTAKRQGWWNTAQANGTPLFEMLARAYAREPQRLVQVAEVVEHLKREGGIRSGALIPPEFLSIWKSFELAMRQDGAL